MNREFETTSEVFGLEEINQTEKRDVNGGEIYDPFNLIMLEIIIMICCHDIPPYNPKPDFRQGI